MHAGRENRELKGVIDKRAHVNIERDGVHPPTNTRPPPSSSASLQLQHLACAGWVEQKKTVCRTPHCYGRHRGKKKDRKDRAHASRSGPRAQQPSPYSRELSDRPSVSVCDGPHLLCIFRGIHTHTHSHHPHTQCNTERKTGSRGIERLANRTHSQDTPAVQLSARGDPKDPCTERERGRYPSTGRPS